MQRIVLILIIFIISISCSYVKTDKKKQDLTNQLSEQLTVLAENIPVNKVPRSFSKNDGYRMENNNDWTCGFPAGSFWYMFELTGDNYWKNKAIQNTDKLNGVQYLTNTHDLGFMVFCSYGNGYKITKDPNYKKIVIQASESLIQRFNPKVGCIRSWDFGNWQFPVIIDNMMNLEMLFWASDKTGDPKYRDVAVSHANTTLKHHFREDMSSFHVVDYDTITGVPINKQTHQGLNDDSAWSRGQAWGLYGFTVCYRETKDIQYLQVSEKIADFIVANLPDDFIAYWDLNDPKIPETYKDASAAAVTASALYELSTYSTKGNEYIKIADKILKSLSSESYLAEQGTNGGFLLKHSVGNMPGNSEIDAAINYADYYYLESIQRKNKLLK